MTQIGWVMWIFSGHTPAGDSATELYERSILMPSSNPKRQTSWVYRTYVYARRFVAKWNFSQYNPDGVRNRFGLHTYIFCEYWAIGDQLRCNAYRTDSSLIFTWGSIAFLVNRYSRWFTPVLRGLVPCPDWSHEMFLSRVNILPLLLIKNANNLSSTTVS